MNQNFSLLFLFWTLFLSTWCANAQNIDTSGLVPDTSVVEGVPELTTIATQAEVDSTYSLFDYFHRSDIQTFRLEFDLQRFRDNKEIDTYQAAILHFQDSSEQQSLPVEIKARGKSRRQLCDWPPLKIKFFPESLPDSQIQGTHGIKLVTHCRKSVGFRDVVLKEYLVYKMLNQLSENSFRVQLIQIEYIDVRNPDESVKQYAFILEGEEQLANRLSGTMVQQRGALSKYVPEIEQINLALFQYLIGNTDWLLDRQHNVKYVKCPASQQLKIVPYDFDMSGIVNASYAIPAKHLPIVEVKERLYLGPCASEEVFQDVLQNLEEERESLLQLIEEFTWLDTRQRKQMTRYLESFYKAIAKKDFIEDTLLESCR